MNNVTYNIYHNVKWYGISEARGKITDFEEDHTIYIQYWSFIYVIWIYKIVVAYIESSGEIIHIIMK